MKQWWKEAIIYQIYTKASMIQMAMALVILGVLLKSWITQISWC